MKLSFSILFLQTSLLASPIFVEVGSKTAQQTIEKVFVDNLQIPRFLIQVNITNGSCIKRRQKALQLCYMDNELRVIQARPNLIRKMLEVYMDK